MKTVMLTGANGYIGSHLTKVLLDFGCKIYAFDINNNNIDKRAEYVATSIFDESFDLNKYIDNVDVCIHLAWKDGFIHNADSHIKELWQHYDFLQKLIDNNIKQLTVMGSMHEIGYWEGAIDEDTPANPQSKYGIAKNTLRQLLFANNTNTKTILQWIRGYYIVGDDIHNHSIFAKILEAANQGKESFPFTSGKTLYDFIDVDELAFQIANVVLQDKINGIINCCSGTPISLAEKVEHFIAEKHLDIRLDYGAYPDRAYDSSGIWGDNKKIQDILSLNNLTMGNK